jgi:hypothetical protein
MTIDIWRPNRDQDRWRLSTGYVMGLKENGDWPDGYENSKAPKTVKAATRLSGDIQALEELTGTDFPALRRVRGRVTGRVLYGFGDASKAAFGATIQIGDHIHFNYGQWNSKIVESSSSNWRELANLVGALQDLAEAGELEGCELFMFTDNSTAEAAYWKGTSTSKELFKLVLDLKKLELKCDMILHVIHVSGKRMIAQGTDGLSRADHSEGVMRGCPITDFVPLHLDPLEREPKLRVWLELLTEGLDPCFLSPEGWYTTGHTLGTFIWTPAPAAAEVVVEQLGRARLKRPESMHVIVVPRVMTGRWRRLLSRGSECWIKIDWDGIWSLTDHFEPLLLFLCLPYRSESPKLEEQTQFLDEFQRFVLRDELLKIPETRRRHILRKFLLRARALRSL